MKKYITVLFVIFFIAVYAYTPQQAYILEHENDLAHNEGGPHNGKGTTTAFSFFTKADDLSTVFRKRILHKGASIGYHLQKEDEVYYIVSGNGEMKMNNETFAVKPGDAILTRPGSSHGLEQKGNDDLVVIITYPAE